MNDQLPLPCAIAPTVAEKRDEAIARVERHAPVEWLAEAERVVLDLAREADTFTTDDVWPRLGGLRPAEPRALGAVVLRLARAKRIAPTGEWRISQRTACNGRPVRVWRAA